VQTLIHLLMLYLKYSLVTLAMGIVVAAGLWLWLSLASFARSARNDVCGCSIEQGDPPPGDALPAAVRFSNAHTRIGIRYCSRQGLLPVASRPVAPGRPVVYPSRAFRGLRQAPASQAVPFLSFFRPLNRGT
jgi:hypothetical protein